jgi:hypothetical protein
LRVTCIEPSLAIVAPIASGFARAKGESSPDGSLSILDEGTCEKNIIYVANLEQALKAMTCIA